MRFNCGPTFEEKWEQRKQWHPWFAWRPVRVDSRDCRWLEWVERKGTEDVRSCGFASSVYLRWTYRAKETA